MWYVYILRCADNSLYIGETNNVDSRVIRHNEGRASLFTAAQRPVLLVYSERHPDRVAALTRERQLKRWTRAKKDALIAGDSAAETTVVFARIWFRVPTDSYCELRRRDAIRHRHVALPLARSLVCDGHVCVVIRRRSAYWRSTPGFDRLQ
jgi:predicted GIY-YIG superfamily endonuclease